MGKGDKKTKKGKIAIGSYGNSRKRSSGGPKVNPAVSKKTAQEGDETPAKPKRTVKKKSEA